jgi:hypothetical protein
MRRIPNARMWQPSCRTQHNESLDREISGDPDFGVGIQNLGTGIVRKPEIPPGKKIFSRQLPPPAYAGSRRLSVLCGESSLLLARTRLP